MIRAGGHRWKKCTNCTKFFSAVHVSILVKLSIHAENTCIKVDEFIIQGGPLVAGTLEKDVGQIAAMIKGIVPDGTYTVRDAYGFQLCAAVECVFSNGGHVVRNDNTPHGSAAGESTFADGNQCIG